MEAVLPFKVSCVRISVIFNTSTIYAISTHKKVNPTFFEKTPYGE